MPGTRPGMTADQAACSLVSALGARISTEPPAFSTAATADLEAPNTESVTLALISPSPSSRTPSLARRRTPALTSAAASILAAASSRPEFDRRLQLAEVHLVELAGEFDVLEAALGEPAMQRHLAALKAFDAHAGARGLTFAAAAAGLALAGADAAADTLPGLAGARTAGKFVQLHCLLQIPSLSCPATAGHPVFA